MFRSSKSSALTALAYGSAGTSVAKQPIEAKVTKRCTPMKVMLGSRSNSKEVTTLLSSVGEIFYELGKSNSAKNELSTLCNFATPIRNQNRRASYFFGLFLLEFINCCGTFSSVFLYSFFSLNLRWSFEAVSVLVSDIQIKELSRF